MEDSFSITNKTRSTLPSVPFAKIKDVALGKKYSLSLVFIGDKKSQELNFTYRNKNKPTNCLSFSLDEKSPTCAGRGEIFINLSKAKKEAKLFERKFDNFVAFLFIHSLMHLKGMDHSSTMERAEALLRKKFKI